MDKILLNQLCFYAYHGALPEENTLGQRFFVDIELRIDLRRAGQTDDLQDSIDYAAVYKAVKEVVEQKQFRLLEALAEGVAARLLSDFSVQEVLVRVQKPDPPIAGHYKSVGVELVRIR